MKLERSLTGASVEQVVTAGTAMAGKGGMLEKMSIQTAATFRRGIRFEGMKFAIGDFVLSCAQASSLGGSKHFIGVIAEVEYSPNSSIQLAKPILEVCYSHHETEPAYEQCCGARLRS